MLPSDRAVSAVNVLLELLLVGIADLASESLGFQQSAVRPGKDDDARVRGLNTLMMSTAPLAMPLLYAKEGAVVTSLGAERAAMARKRMLTAWLA